VVGDLLAGGVNRFVLWRLVQLQSVLVTVLGAILEAMGGHVSPGVLISLGLCVVVLLVILGVVVWVGVSRLVPNCECGSVGALGVAVDRSASGLDPARGDVYVAELLMRLYDPVTGEQELLRIVSTSSMPRGTPLQIKHVNVTITGPGFTFNLTNRDKMEITGGLDSTASQTLSVSFRATSCATLGFAPKLTVSTSGKTSKANGASLNVKLTYPKAPFGS
jgi:hypothetical protein